MQPPGRCPRCGYPLRIDRGRYTCDFCGFPNARPPMIQSIRTLERNLRAKIQELLDTRGRNQYERMIVQNPRAPELQNCSSCGLRIPYGSMVCPYCRAPQNRSRPQSTPQPNAEVATINATDQRVLDYIVGHNGTISMSQAARDLSMSPDALHLIIERLKSSGFLKPA